jgi:hypothetical protein
VKLIIGQVRELDVLKIVGDSAWGHRARAHAVGYTHGLLSEVEAGPTR